MSSAEGGQAVIDVPIRRIVAVAAVLILTAAACGSTAEETAETTTSTSTSSTSSSTSTTEATSTSGLDTSSSTTIGEDGADGGDDTDDTIDDGTTTSATTQTTQTTASTTTSSTTTTVATTTTTLPPALAEAAFAFAAGTDPRINVQVLIGESPDGPWLAAGPFDPAPSLSGPKFWIRFEITNEDSLGTVTDVELSGVAPDPGPIGSDVCPIDEPIPRSETAVCVLGGADGFDVDPAGAEYFFDASGEGFRQGVAPEVYFDPPIPSGLGFDDSPYRFILVFDHGGGVRIDGKAYAPDVMIGLAGLGLANPVPVDCSDSFPGGVSSTGGSPTAGEPRLVAHVMATFADDGTPTGSCSHIPTQPLPFLFSGGSDFSLVYTTN